MAIDRVRVNERSTRVIEFDILDQAGAAVPAASLTAAALTLLDVETYVPGASPEDGIINGRAAQNVLNANQVTIDASGHVTYTMAPEDNVIITARRHVERHRAEFTFVWATGALWFPCEIEVVNLRKAS